MEQRGTRWNWKVITKSSEKAGKARRKPAEPGKARVKSEEPGSKGRTRRNVNKLVASSRNQKEEPGGVQRR